MRAIFKRELYALLHSVRAWAFAFLTLAVSSVCVYLLCIRTQNPAYEQACPYIAYALAAFIPLVTAPVFAGDRKQHTERLLAALPVRPLSIALGKFLACLVPVAIVCVLLLVNPLALRFIGINSFSTAMSTHFALCFFATMITALGVLMSSLIPFAPLAWLATVAASGAAYLLPRVTSGMITATGMTTMTMLGIMVLFFAVWMLVTDGNLFVSLLCTAVCEVPVVICRLRGRSELPVRYVGRALNKLCWFAPLNTTYNGVLCFADLLYYLTIAVFLLALTALVVRGRRQGVRRAIA